MNPPPDRVRLVTYNIHSCRGMDGKVVPERIAEVLAELEPDAVGLQEVDVWMRRSGRRDQAEEIAHRLGMELFFQPSRRAGQGLFGNAVLTRHPARLRRAGLYRKFWAPLENRGAVWVELQLPGGPLHFVTTHLGLLHHERQRQLDELLGPGWLHHPERTGALVVGGDFNATGRSPEMRRLTAGLHDPTRGLRVRTFPGRAPLWQLDHLLTTPCLGVGGARVADSRLARVASDHLPLCLDVLPTGTPVAGPGSLTGWGTAAGSA